MERKNAHVAVKKRVAARSERLRKILNDRDAELSESDGVTKDAVQVRNNHSPAARVKDSLHFGGRNDPIVTNIA
jgi:hypothetical protein